jgi:hypothetical protein
MKSQSKNLVRTLVLGSILAGGVTLAQSFYNEAQASTENKKNKICSTWTVNGVTKKKCDGTGTECASTSDCS